MGGVGSSVNQLLSVYQRERFCRSSVQLRTGDTRERGKISACRIPASINAFTARSTSLDLPVGLRHRRINICLPTRNPTAPLGRARGTRQVHGSNHLNTRYPRRYVLCGILIASTRVGGRNVARDGSRDVPDRFREEAIAAAVERFADRVNQEGRGTNGRQ